MKIIRMIVIVLSLFNISLSAVADDVVVTDTVMPFFNALKQGDVNAIKTYIDDPLYSRIKVLLNDNKTYPDYLRKWYAGAIAEVVAITKTANGDYIVDLRIMSPDRPADINRLRIAENKEGSWKVVDQILAR